MRLFVLLCLCALACEVEAKPPRGYRRGSNSRIVGPTGPAVGICGIDCPVETATTVACLGDSITNGVVVGVDYTFPRQLQAALGTMWPTANHGISGQRVDQMLARLRTNIVGKGYTRLVLLGGINDIIQDLTAAAIYANIQTVVSEAAADGMTVYVLTVLPFGDSVPYWSAPRQAVLEALNALIMGGTGYTPIDTYTALQDPADLDALLPAHAQADGLHLDESGTGAMAVAVDAVVNP